MAACILYACCQSKAQETNRVTLYWSPATNDAVPFFYEVQQSNGDTNNWFKLIELASFTTNYAMILENKETKFWRVRSVNSINDQAKSMFSNTASVSWSNVISSCILGIRLGP